MSASEPDPATDTTLARVIVSVAALDHSLPFYEGVLGLQRGYALPGLVMLRTSAAPAVEVLLHERPPTPGDAGIAVSFGVPDVDLATAAAVAAGCSEIDPPADQAWGERQSVLHDPDGHVVCLVGPLEETGESAGR